MSSQGSESLKQKIARLENMASDVLRSKRADRPRRPFIIEFCGSPKSGKSSAISSLTIFLKRNGFKVQVLEEQASVAPISDKTDWIFNAWTGMASLVEVIPYIANSRSDIDVVICDRGIYDALCWFRWLRNRGAMTDEEFVGMRAPLTISRLRKSIDLIYVFKATPDASIKREYATLLTRKRGSIMNEEILRSYLSSIEETVGENSSMFRNCQVIDTTELTQNQVGGQVTETVLGELQAVIEERVGYLSRELLERLFSGEKNSMLWRDTPEWFRAKVSLGFKSRSALEEDELLVQPIPVAVLTDQTQRRVAVLSKSAESLGADRKSPEAGKFLPYAGGHIRQEDAFDVAGGNFMDIARSCLQRELFEELGINASTLKSRVGDFSSVLLIWDRDSGNPKSRMHLAVVSVFRVDLDALSPKLDDYEFSKSNVKSFRILEVQDLENKYHGKLEAWGRTIIDQLFDAHSPLQLEIGLS